MLIMPYQFMWISVVSIFSIIGTGLFVYLALLPCPDFGRWKYFIKRNWKRKNSYFNGASTTSDAGKNTNINTQTYPNMSKYSNGCCITEAHTISNAHQRDAKDVSPNQEKSSVLTGPQGHGFYTAGPWKMDTLGADTFNQFSNPEFLMTEYFASMMSPHIPPETTEETMDSDEAHNCRVFGDLIVCTENETDDNSNDYAFMDMSSQSDADMVMMMF